MRHIQELRMGEKKSIQELTRQLGGGIDKRYFDWSGALKEQMESVFGIKSFRLAQEGLWEVAHVPATCDTHAGMHAGSLASSGSVALIKDQILHLQERRSKDNDRLRATVKGSDPTKEVKLCYVTVRGLSLSLPPTKSA
ncbi:hypothetical protein EDB87DRAFT_1582329 [Lactarius vividus]|nr:hypothetical protein EDB87DRAFT_1582329 [Lactarius vividus]